eukprot:gene11521-biopygen15690
MLPPKPWAVKRGKTLQSQLNNGGMQQHNCTLWKPEVLVAHLNRDKFTYHDVFDVALSESPGTLRACVLFRKRCKNQCSASNPHQTTKQHKESCTVARTSRTEDGPQLDHHGWGRWGFPLQGHEV